ncbi:MAG: hypothetical protein J6W84_06335 [Bacteroidales bacterium]|nr:hypothetical protein [Bacteroidales bacterium]
MKEQEKKMLELVREIYKLAKDFSQETTYLSISVDEQDDSPFAIHINNNYWEIETETEKIELWGGITK